MTPDAKIAELLLSKIAAITLTPALPVSWPDVQFTPPAGTYLEVKLFPSTTLSPYLSNDDPDRFHGFIQVTVVSPAGQGELGPKEIAGKISDQLSKSSFSGGGVTGSIVGRPTVHPALQATDRLWTRVRADYRASA